MRPVNPSRRGEERGSTVPHGAEASLGEVAQDVMDQALGLVRAEARLLKAELGQSIDAAKRGIVLIAVAAALAIAATVMALVTIMAILAALGVPVWLAALLTTLIALGGAVPLARAGIKKATRGIIPSNTTEQLERDRAMVQEKFR